MSLSTLRGATATKAHGSKKAHIKTLIPLERPMERKYQKHEYISFKLKNNPGQANSGEYEFTIPFFHTGSPEETILLVQNIQKIFLGLDLTTGSAQYTIVRRILKGDALAAFNRFATDHGAETVAHMKQCLNDVIKHILPKRALTYQKQAMRRFMRKPAEMSMRDFMARLTEINSYLQFFPPFDANANLPMDELVDIGEFAVPLSWQREMVLQGYEPADHDTDELVKFCDRLEQAADTYEKPKTDKDRIPRKRKNESLQWCQICHMNNHSTEECSWLNKARDLKSKPSAKKRLFNQKEKRPTKKESKEQTFTMEEVKNMMNKFATTWRKKEREAVQNVETSEETPSEGEASGTETSEASVHGITEADEELMDDVFEDINN